MIIDLSLKDFTQQMIFDHLKETERLLIMASGSGDITQIMMQDACPAHNITRMLNGHFTGTVTQIKNTKEPFIPVGTTVNVCGVTIYKLRHEIKVDEFKSRIYQAIEESPKPYTWNNFNRGNHFVSLMYSEGKNGLEEGQYLVVHASANEYKGQLYPTKGVWYEDQIKNVTLPDDSKRSLKYITGTCAEKFYKIAEKLLPFNRKRNSDFCEYVLKNGLADKEILNVQHYGMPNPETICIGVQWETKNIVPLLTAPGKPIYLIQPDQNTEYFPHGFGLEIYDGDIHYTSDNGIYVGNKVLHSNESLSIGVDAFNRAERTPLEKCVENTLKQTPGKIVGTLNQIASLSAKGVQVWQK